MRWASWLGVSAEVLGRVSMGEGDTPLVWVQIGSGGEVALKLEGQNPTGSFKDRGAVALVAAAVERGIRDVVEDSSGNAGAALAAYAARAGIRARVFVPEAATGAKLFQIALHGAQVVRVPGPRSAAAEAAMAETRGGVPYASHAHQPFQIAGYATLAFELVEQLGEVPGVVVAPAGQGGLLLGLYAGFRALVGTEVVRMPLLVGVQAAACAPLARAAGNAGPEAGGATCAEGIRVDCPVRQAELIELAHRGAIRFSVATEEEIHAGRTELASRGIGAELTSGVIWRTLERGMASGLWRPPVVGIVTAHALKTATAAGVREA